MICAAFTLMLPNNYLHWSLNAARTFLFIALRNCFSYIINNFLFSFYCPAMLSQSRMFICSHGYIKTTLLWLLWLSLYALPSSKNGQNRNVEKYISQPDRIPTQLQNRATRYFRILIRIGYPIKDTIEALYSSAIYFCSFVNNAEISSLTCTLYRIFESSSSMSVHLILHLRLSCIPTPGETANEVFP